MILGSKLAYLYDDRGKDHNVYIGVCCWYDSTHALFKILDLYGDYMSEEPMLVSVEYGDVMNADYVGYILTNDRDAVMKLVRDEKYDMITPIENIIHEFSNKLAPLSYSKYTAQFRYHAYHLIHDIIDRGLPRDMTPEKTKYISDIIKSMVRIET